MRIGAYHTLRLGGVVQARRNRAVSAGKGWCSVLVFHRVTDDAPEDGITIRPLRFARILDALQRSHQVIGASELLSRIESGRPFSGREVVISFDDGYRDNAVEAAPLLAARGLPAVFFLTAGYVGTDKSFAWDRQKGVVAPMMTWGEAKQLARQGFELGCHTWSHPDLGSSPLSSAPQEVELARRTIEERAETPVQHFAYPFGGRNNIRPEWVSHIKAAGFRSLFCGFGGAASSTDDPFWIPRMGASHQRTISELMIDIDQPW